MTSKFCSIVYCTYPKCDDFGETAGVGINRSETMKQSIQSLIRETDYPAELIVIDNGGNPDDTDYLLGLLREGKINTLIRNKENMHFAFAWNQGIKIANGDYLVLTCNDIFFGPKWLSKMIWLLEKYPEALGKKLIASPLCAPSQDRFPYHVGMIDGYKVNKRAGSNCIVLRKTDIDELGLFRHHRIAGSKWYDNMKQKGYAVIVPPENLVVDLGFRRGVNFTIPIKVKETLLTNKEVDFTDPEQI